MNRLHKQLRGGRADLSYPKPRRAGAARLPWVNSLVPSDKFDYSNLVVGSPDTTSRFSSLFCIICSSLDERSSHFFSDACRKSVSKHYLSGTTQTNLCICKLPCPQVPTSRCNLLGRIPLHFHLLRGVKHLDVCCSVLPNCVEYVPAYLGTMMVGGVCLGADEACTEGSIVHPMNLVDPLGKY